MTCQVSWRELVWIWTLACGLHLGRRRHVEQEAEAQAGSRRAEKKWSKDSLCCALLCVDDQVAIARLYIHLVHALFAFRINLEYFLIYSQINSSQPTQQYSEKWVKPTRKKKDAIYSSSIANRVVPRKWSVRICVEYCCISLVTLLLWVRIRLFNPAPHKYKRQCCCCNYDDIARGSQEGGRTLPGP